MTPYTGYRTITITTLSEESYSKLKGNFRFNFNGESFLFAPGASNFNAAQCKAAFEGLANVKQVKCTVTTTGTSTVVYTVELQKFPVLPLETSVFSNDGNPPLSSFSCNTDEITQTNSNDLLTCTIGETGTTLVYPGENHL